MDETIVGSKPDVEYREIPGCPGYIAGDDGSIWSSDRDGSRRKRLSVCRDRHGYGYVSIRGSGYRRTRVHTLVLTAFLGPRPDGMDCRHLDGDPANNVLSNLRWGTHAENMRDTIRHGRTTAGERSHWAKLKASDVLEIRQLRFSGDSLKSIAHRFNISVCHVCGIAMGRYWKRL